MFLKTYGSDSAHRVVDTARAKSTLDDFESSSLAEDKVARRDADVLESDVAMSMGSIVVAIHRKHPVDGDALGGPGDQDDRLLLVHVLVVRIALPHDDIDSTARITRATRPPFLAKSASTFSLQYHTLQ